MYIYTFGKTDPPCFTLNLNVSITIQEVDTNIISETRTQPLTDDSEVCRDIGDCKTFFPWRFLVSMIYVFLALFSIVTGAISGFPLLPFLVGRCRKHLLSSIYWLIFDGLCVSPSTIFIHLLISSTFVFRVHTFSGGECKTEVKE